VSSGDYGSISEFDDPTRQWSCCAGPLACTTDTHCPSMSTCNTGFGGAAHDLPWKISGNFEGQNEKSPEFGAFRGAGDGVRTRDIQLGKLTLYQLSYSRAGQGR
jgi:hypothetical protein